MCRNLQRRRQQALPQSPQTAVEVECRFREEEIMKAYGNTVHESPNVFFKTVFTSKSFSYCIFASDAIIRNINEYIAIDRRNYFMDATFKVCPYGEFTQLLIIYVEYMEQVTINT